MAFLCIEKEPRLLRSHSEHFLWKCLAPSARALFIRRTMLYGQFTICTMHMYYVINSIIMPFICNADGSFELYTCVRHIFVRRARDCSIQIESNVVHAPTHLITCAKHRSHHENPAKKNYWKIFITNRMY